MRNITRSLNNESYICNIFLVDVTRGWEVNMINTEAVFLAPSSEVTQFCIIVLSIPTNFFYYLADSSHILRRLYSYEKLIACHFRVTFCSLLWW